MAANDSYSQQALAGDAQFATRVRAQLIAKAFAVLAEAPVVAARVAYARRILDNAGTETQRVLPILVLRTNVMAFQTSYDFQRGAVVTAAGDPDILAQLSADFSMLAGA